jgi:hypothetical protein
MTNFLKRAGERREALAGGRQGLKWAASFLAGATLAGVTVAHAAGTVPSAIHACVNAKTRALTVPKGATCPKGAFSVQWSVRGPRGAQGPRGARGATGASDWPSVFASPAYDFSSPNGMASDGSHLWIANPIGDSVTEVKVSDGSLVRNLHGGAYHFNNPEAVWFDGAHIWVAGYLQELVEINPSDGSFIRSAGDTSLAVVPGGLASDGANIWVASFNSDSVSEFRASDGSLVNSYSGGSYNFSGPSALTFDGSHVWVASTNNDSVTELNASDGSFVRNLTGGSYRFSRPDSIIFAKVGELPGVGHIWVANYGNDSLTELNGSGALIRNLSGASLGFSGPNGLAYDGTDVWVANHLGDSVTEVNADSGQWVRTDDGGVFGLSEPAQVVIAGSREWVTNFGTGSITELPPG